MTPCWPRTADLLLAREERRLGPDGAAWLERHLATCGPCRQEAAQGEPLALFAPLAGERPLPAGAEAFILGGLRVAQEERQVPARRWRPEPLAAAASLAAAALVLLWAAAGVWTGPEPQAPAALQRAWAEAPLPPHVMNNAVATVEDIRSSTAEVLAFSFPGGASGNTEVILIVDRSIDL